jgi:hypothetical protein
VPPAEMVPGQPIAGKSKEYWAEAVVRGTEEVDERPYVTASELQVDQAPGAVS